LPPTSFAATGVTNTSISLGWVLPVGSAPLVSFEVDYDPVVSSGTQTYSQSLPISGGTWTGATVSGLMVGTAYAFRVSSFSSTQQSAYSYLASASTTGTPAVPSAVGTITFSLTTASGFTASWAAPTGGGVATNYSVAYGTSSSLSGAATTTTSGATSIALTGLSPNMKYYVAVTASNGGGNATASTIQTGTASWTLANAPTFGASTYQGGLPTMTPSSYSSSALAQQPVSFTASAGGATSYTVRWATSLSSGALVNPYTESSGTTFTSVTLGAAGSNLAAYPNTTASGAVYPYVGNLYWQVTAYNGAGIGVQSAVQQVPAPAQVSQASVASTSVTTTTISLQWTAPGSGYLVEGYRVRYGVGSATTVFLGTVTATGTTCSCVLGSGSDGVLTANTTYQVIVESFGAGGLTSSSPTATPVATS